MSLASRVAPISPDQAKKWLENQHERQRPLRGATVARYAQMMTAGQWLCTAQGITFDDRGKLIDGAHRLSAIVQSGVSVKMRITNGEDPENFKAYDCGAIRTSADRTILDEADRTRNKRLVTLVRSYYCYGVAKNGTATSAECLRLVYQEHKRGFDSVTDAAVAQLVRKNSCVMAAVAIYADLHPGRASSFIARLSGNAAMRELDPAHKLLLYLSQRSHRGGLPDYWYAVSACNVDLRGAPCHKLTIASEDMAGNRLERVARARTDKSRRGAKTKAGL